jgi:two-component system cell cycle sensor histidine kinase PleC
MMGEQDARTIARQQWKVLLRNLPAAMLGNAATLVVMGATLWWYGGGYPALGWMAGGLLLQALRYGFWLRRRHRAVAARHPEPWRRLFILGNALAGLWWGIGMPLIVPPDHQGLITLTGVFVGGLLAGALASTAVVTSAFLAFSMSIAVPIAVFFATDLSIVGFTLAGAVLGFAGLMTIVALNLSRQTRELLEMRSSKNHLVRDLAKARDRAEASDRAKSRFLATMSHELRTPLNIILGFAQTIEQRLLGPLGDERYGEYAGTIRESGEQLLTLINDVLDLSRIGSGQYVVEPEHLKLDGIVEEVRRGMAEEASQQEVAMFATVEPDLPPVWADRRAVRQILSNLLSNAIKFTPAGGSVEISATRDGTGRLLRLSIADTGVGIAPDMVDQVLSPFVQADGENRRRYQGTGLGLALSKQLTELQGGSLALSSVEAAGTTVTMTLPVAASENDANPHLPAQPTGTTGDEIEGKTKAPPLAARVQA